MSNGRIMNTRNKRNCTGAMFIAVHQVRIVGGKG